MEEQQKNNSLNLDNLEVNSFRRRDLLPWWIKTFTWIFLVFGAFIPIGLLFGLMGKNFSISLYGLETINPFSFLGLFLIFIFLIKGITAFGLWTEEKWAVDLGIYDAILGLVVCGAAMFVVPFMDESKGFSFNLRLEPILLIFYLIKLKNIKALWKE